MQRSAFLDRCFQFASYTALVAWLAVFAFPGWVVANLNWMLLPITLLCLVYVFTLVIGSHFDGTSTQPRGHFFTMGGVVRLFKHPRAVLIGWVHFLAFDLAIGIGIVVDASTQGFSHWWILPSLFLTLMLGPAGLLSYLALRVLIL